MVGMDTDDETLLHQVQRERNTTAWNLLYERYAERLYRFLYYRVGRREAEAQDLFQETLLTAVDRIHTCRESFASWLWGIARHKLLHFYRSQARRQERETPMSQMDQALEEWMDRFETHDLPDELLVQQETRQFIGAALSALPPHYQRGLVLKYVEGRTLEDIGQECRMSVSAVGHLLFRARAAFKIAFAKLTQGELTYDL